MCERETREREGERARSKELGNKKDDKRNKKGVKKKEPFDAA